MRLDTFRLSQGITAALANMDERVDWSLWAPSPMVSEMVRGIVVLIWEIVS